MPNAAELLNVAAAGEAVREYINATVPLMAFGEYWDTCDYTDGVLNYNQDSHRQRTVNWCDKTGGTAAAFDFTTKGGSACCGQTNLQQFLVGFWSLHVSLGSKKALPLCGLAWLASTESACDAFRVAGQSYRGHVS